MIYYLEDDTNIRDLAIYALKQAGLSAQGFSSPSAFFSALKVKTPELVLLDIMLPEIDGLEVLRRLRAETLTRNVPVMMLTAKGTEFDKVTGLDAGADDYLAKPFGVRELLARTRALLRRSQGTEASAPSNEVTASGITLNEDTHVAKGDKGPIDLTPREFELLCCLMRNAGKVVSREDLLRDAWGWEFITETKTVDTHIKRLRDKIETAGYDPKLVETVRGYGYRFKK